MENASFDDLLQAVRTNMAAAQEVLWKRRADAQRQRYEEQEANGGQDVALTFISPRNAGSEEVQDALTLPLSSFLRPCRARLATFALSFDCALEEEGFPGAERVYRVVMAGEDEARLWWKKRRRMQIVFRAMEQPCGEVLLDGDVLMPIPPSPGSAGEGSAQQAKPPLLARLYRLLRRLWPRQGFVMTAEQSRLVRQMLAQQDAAAMSHGGVAL